MWTLGGEVTSHFSNYSEVNGDLLQGLLLLCATDRVESSC